MCNYPLITVYIPTKDRADMISAAVDSVLAQDYPRVEIIVVDDGSSDNTTAVLDAHPDRARFRVISLKTPLGAAAARNMAIDKAQGRYITGMDDDDSFTPTRLTHLVRSYQTGRWSCVASAFRERDGAKEIIRRTNTGVIDYEGMRHYNKLGNQVLTATSRLRAIGGFDTILPAFQDYDAWIRLVAQFGPAYKLREASYIVNLGHGSSRISDDRERVARAFDMFMEKHGDELSVRHQQSMHLLRRRIERSPISTGDFLRNVNFGNYKMAVPLLINSSRGLSLIKPILKARFRKITSSDRST